MWLDTPLSPTRGADLSGPRTERPTAHDHMSPRAPRLYLTALHACGKAKKEGGYSAGDERLELELISDRRVGGGVLGRGRGRRGRPG